MIRITKGRVTRIATGVACLLTFGAFLPSQAASATPLPNARQLAAATAQKWATLGPTSSLGSGFSITDLRAGRVQAVSTGLRPHTVSAGAAEYFFSVGEAADGTIATIDKSLLDQGLLAATNPKFVTLSWDLYSPTARYGVSRDGKVVAKLSAGISNFRDTSVVSGKNYRYNIVPLDADSGSPSGAHMWSSNVRVPVPPAKPTASVAQTLQAQATTFAAAAVGATSTVTYETFIPPEVVKAVEASGS